MLVVEILLLVGLIVFITHTVEAVTGFGCTVLAFPFVIALMGDLEQAKIVLTALAWVLVFYFVVTKFKHIQWKKFRTTLLLSVLGMPAGMLLFKSLDAGMLKMILGVFIVISAAIQLYKSFVPVAGTARLPKLIGYTFLFAGGIFHGAFAVGGPLIVLYSTRKIPDKGQFRATMCLLWLCLNTVLIFQYIIERKLTFTIGCEFLFLLPFLVAGIFAGEAIHNKVSEILFKKIVFSILLLVGIIMVIWNK